MTRLLVLLAGLALLVGCGAPPATAPPATPAASATVAAPVALPVAVTIPAIGARSDLEPVGLNPDGTMEVPPVTEPEQAAWFTGAPRPGEPGPATIVGHVDGGGQAGVFARLGELQPGDAILVARADGSTVEFRVSRVEQYPKAALPWDTILGETAGPELRLITCGGEFDPAAESYEDNVVAYAGAVA